MLPITYLYWCWVHFVFSCSCLFYLYCLTNDFGICDSGCSKVYKNSMSLGNFQRGWNISRETITVPLGFDDASNQCSLLCTFKQCLSGTLPIYFLFVSTRWHWIIVLMVCFDPDNHCMSSRTLLSPNQIQVWTCHMSWGLHVLYIYICVAWSLGKNRT
jgi:hypothetical protein